MPEQSKSIEFVPIEDLTFDLQNPRLPSRVRKKQSQAAVLKWLLDEEKVIELMIAIGEHGYFRGEPVLVVENPKGSDIYTVVEGNRRLAAAKLLKNPELAPIRQKSVQRAATGAPEEHKPDELPTIEFDSRDDILQYLGYRHVTGVEVWDPLAKARYAEQLFGWAEGKDPEEKYRALARSIGSSSRYVRHLLSGLAVYREIEKKNFYNIQELDEGHLDFSVLTTALSYSNIARFVGIEDELYPALEVDQSKLEKLTRIIFERLPELGGKTRLGESRNLTYLGAVVGNPRAMAAFEAGAPLQEATMLTDVPLRIFRKAIRDARNKLQTAQRYIHEIESMSDEEARVLGDIRAIAGDLVTLVEKRIGQQEEG